NDDGEVTFNELTSYVQKEVPREGKQSPSSWALASRGDIIVARTGKPPFDAKKRAVREKLLAPGTQELLTVGAINGVLSIMEQPPSTVLRSGQKVEEVINSLVPKIGDTSEFVQAAILLSQEGKIEKAVDFDHIKKPLLRLLFGFVVLLGVFALYA